MRYRKDVFPSQLLCPVCKNQIEDESHVLFKWNTYERFRKEVNIIATASIIQDTFKALFRGRRRRRVCYSAFTLSVQSLRHDRPDITALVDWA